MKAFFLFTIIAKLTYLSAQTQNVEINFIIDDGGLIENLELTDYDVFILSIDDSGKNIYQPAININKKFYVPEHAITSSSFAIVRLKKYFYFFGIGDINLSGQIKWTIEITSNPVNKDYKKEAELIVEYSNGLTGIVYYTRIRRPKAYKRRILHLLNLP
ncbi:MAG: hypothetical protein AAFO91_04390 [Bacteroidota bacterium]